MSAPHSPPLPVTVPIDFPDWISPIIVKEIRQGLRGWFFASSFIVLHFILMSWAIMSGALTDVSGSGSDELFWTILTVGLFVITLRANGVIRSEKKGNTLELLQLTRETPWRIVAGKWGAVMIQSGLFISSLLPYAILRYFLGRLEIVMDLLIISGVFFTISAAAAFFVWLSALPRFIGIGANVIIGVAVLFSMMSLLPYFLFSGGSGGIGFRFDLPGEIALCFAGFAVYSTLYVLLFLGMAAGKVVLGSERVVVRKRVLGWAILLPAIAAGIAHAAGILAADFVFTAMTLCAPAVIVFFDAILSPTTPSIPAFRAFGKRGFFGKIAALFFAPSQSAGMIYGVVTLVGFMTIPVMLDGVFFERSVDFFALLSLIFLPLALTRLSGKILPALPIPVRYFGFLVLEILFTLLCRGFGSAGILPLWEFVSLISPASILSARNSIDELQLLAVAIMHSLVAGGILLRFFVKDFSVTQKMLRGERAELPAF